MTPGPREATAGAPTRPRRRLPFYTRYTFRHHSRAEALFGIYQALFDLRGYVARKTLAATAIEVAIVTSIPNIAQMFAMTWRTLLLRVDRRKALVWIGIGGKGLLVLVALLSSSWTFALLCCTVAVVDSAFVPLRNLLFQSNYPPNLRGALFSTAFSITIATTLVVSLSATSCLDRWASSYRWLYPIAGLAGVAVHAIYARARLRRSAKVGGRTAPSRRAPLERVVAAARIPIVLTRSILRRDERFRSFESGFFLYGLTFMMNDVLVVFLAADTLGASYKQISLAQTVIPLSVMILCFPLWGRFLDRSGPLRVASVAFIGVGAWTLALMMATTIPMLYVASILRGVGMAGVQVVWNLGPMQLAPRGKARDYMGVHVTLVGLRAAVAPPLAIVLRQVVGVHAALGVGSAFALAGALLTRRASQRE